MASAGGDSGAPVVVARGLARVAGGGVVAVSGKVARGIDRRRARAQSTYRGRLEIEGVAEIEVVELRPSRAKVQSPWMLRRRWTWIAAIAAVVLLPAPRSCCGAQCARRC